MDEQENNEHWDFEVYLLICLGSRCAAVLGPLVTSPATRLLLSIICSKSATCSQKFKVFDSFSKIKLLFKPKFNFSDYKLEEHISFSEWKIWIKLTLNLKKILPARFSTKLFTSTNRFIRSAFASSPFPFSSSAILSKIFEIRHQNWRNFIRYFKVLEPCYEQMIK